MPAVLILITLFSSSLTCWSQQIKVIDQSGDPVQFCHICDHTLTHCSITGIEGRFELAPFLEITDTLVLKHVGLKRLEVSIADIGKVIVMPEKIEELQGVYVTDVGPKELFRKALQNTLSRAFLSSQFSRSGFQRYFEEGQSTDSLLIQDTLDLKRLDDDEKTLYKFLTLNHSATNAQYINDYQYELVGYYDRGMVIEQRLLGLKDRFHFKYFINDELAIEEMYFQYHFDLQNTYYLHDTNKYKYLWKGHVEFDVNPNTICPKELILEEHFKQSKVELHQYQKHHELGVYRLSPLE